jgi:predicted helicase
VRRSLLNRLHGFELLPAPCPVARLHLSRRLAGKDLPAGPMRDRCAHRFATDEQIDIHRTNGFEEMAARLEQVLGNFGPDKVQNPTSRHPQPDRAILTIVGNPPYRGLSANREKWLARLLEDYRQVNGVPLAERKVWLRNDYVQFIRFGQWAIEHVGQGILALVTDHSYLDSATFRGMRQSLIQTFDEIYVLNLHGNAKRRERAPDGTPDESVFDIRQGVAIVLFVKQGMSSIRESAAQPRTARVHYGDLWGSRQSKLAYLAANHLETISWKSITPVCPSFELVAVKRRLRAEYEAGWPIKEIFPVSSSGIQTSRDSLVTAFDDEILRRRLDCFLDTSKPEQEIRDEFFGDRSAGAYPPGDTRQWKLAQARKSLRHHRSWPRTMITYLYRPFDPRSLLYLDFMVDWPRWEVMRHLQQHNYALCIGRAGVVTSGTWNLVFCVNQMCDHNLFYRGGSLNFPLYLYTAEGSANPNLSRRFVDEITKVLGVRFIGDRSADLSKTIGPEDILQYAYAVLHSSSYRRRYGEFLKFDFPRLPLTANSKLFRALCARGEKLVRCHLMEEMGPTPATFPIRGDNSIRQVRYLASAGRVGINATQYFENVPPDVWQYCVGGYQVCRKWLKDRKGRRLTSADQHRFLQIVRALSRTIGLIREIDAIIEEHGGWPIRNVNI